MNAISRIRAADQLVSAADELARIRFLPFLMLVYELLHPGRPPLKPSWYLRAIAYWLERVEGGALLRSMIWLQPRALKSIAVAVAFPCWLLGRDPTRQIFAIAVNGLVLTILFDALQAPDVALSELAVGSAAVPLLFLVALMAVRTQPPEEKS